MFTGSAILPATQALFNKLKVSLSEIPSHWPEGTVVVCKKPNGALHFIAGASGNYFTLNSQRQFYHDQTGSSFGEWHVINEVAYKTVGDQVQWTPTVAFDSQLNTTTKAALAVFK